MSSSMSTPNSSSKAIMAEISPEVKMHPPPVVSEVSFTPFNSKQDQDSKKQAAVRIHLPSRLYTCENILSASDCRKLVYLLNFSSAEEDTQKKYLQQIQKLGIPLFRTNMKRKYIDEKLAATLAPIFQEFLPETLPDGRKFVGVRSAMNFFRYSPGEYFTTHLDGGFSSTATGHSSEYTFVVYLNDDFEGGTTRFCGIPEWGGARDVKPCIGGISIFRQSDMKHSGVTIKSGFKFILQGMVMYSEISTSALGRPIPKKANAFSQVNC